MCPTFVEPFLGSAAVLLARPDQHQWWDRIETANDADGMVANFWRATQADPDAVAHYADWPIVENCLHARHAWLVGQKDSLQARLEGDPDYFDAKIAGWWVWGMCAWIGSGFCSGQGPWHVEDGQLTDIGNAGQGINRKRTHLGNAGMGINRQLPHLGDAGMGINRQLPHLSSAGQGLCAEWSAHLRDMMGLLRDRLRRVRVECGDWSRVCGDAPTQKLGLTGVFLDAPYSAEAGRDNDLYRVESKTVAHDVRAWALEHGDNPLYRIALCGYDGEYDMPESWEALHWKTKGGYGSQGEDNGRENGSREVVWFSPHCLKTDRPQQGVFDL